MTEAKIGQLGPGDEILWSDNEAQAAPSAAGEDEAGSAGGAAATPGR